MIEDVKCLSYDERMTRLGLTHLDMRQVRSDLLETFRIVCGMDEIDEELKRCVHKLSKSQKVDLRKSLWKLWT